MRIQAFIRSLQDIENNTHNLDEVTMLRQIGSNLYLVEYKGVKCAAIFNPFVNRYFVDDVDGIWKEED